jgi:hypothetical protein
VSLRLKTCHKLICHSTTHSNLVKTAVLRHQMFHMLPSTQEVVIASGRVMFSDNFEHDLVLLEIAMTSVVSIVEWTVVERCAQHIGEAHFSTPLHSGRYLACAASSPHCRRSLRQSVVEIEFRSNFVMSPQSPTHVYGQIWSISCRQQGHSTPPECVPDTRDSQPNRKRSNHFVLNHPREHRSIPGE